MALRDRYITFNGVNLKAAHDLRYVGFEEELPEPKTIKVDIPAGMDIDITEAIGPVAYHDGKHTFTFFVYRPTASEVFDVERELISTMHGKRAAYRLSWDPGFTYTGRAKVSIEHRGDVAALVTIEIEHAPWKTGALRTIDVNCHPSGTARLEGYDRYHTVRARLMQSGTTKVGYAAAVSRSAGTFLLADDLYADDDYADTMCTFTVDDWWQYINGTNRRTNLVVNTNHISFSGNNAQFDSNWTLNGTDLYCANEEKQHVTVTYYGWDVA